MDWQPIEAAPKDGTPIVGYNSERGYIGIVVANSQNEWELVEFNGLARGIGFYPDLYAPLPDPPATP